MRMKSFKSILLNPLQVLKTQLITFFSSHSYDYASQKMFQFETQVLTNQFNIRF